MKYEDRKAIRALKMPPVAKSVLHCLVEYSNESGECWPSIAAIAEFTCFGERAIQGAIRFLIQCGIVVRESRWQKTPVYVISMAGIAQYDPAAHSPAPSAPAPHAPLPRTTCTLTPHHVRKTPAPRAPDLVLTTNELPVELAVTKRKRARKPAEDLPLQEACRETWKSYAKAIEKRWGRLPIRNAQVSSMIKRFVQAVGMQEAPQIAEFYVGSQNSYYIGRCHPVDCLLKDSHKLAIEWGTGRRTTQAQARQQERTASNGFLALLSEMEAAGVGN